VVSLVTQYSPIRIDVNKKGLSSATFEYFLRFSAPKAKKLSLLFVQISTQEKPPPPCTAQVPNPLVNKICPSA
jgi:hypothetical protein